MHIGVNTYAYIIYIYINICYLRNISRTFIAMISIAAMLQPTTHTIMLQIFYTIVYLYTDCPFIVFSLYKILTNLFCGRRCGAVKALKG